ncbi:MAG: UbiD family decarboxylase [Chloroflexi bacterium]|nr:UbiD family decarboxylase [Chloroflexota bacterium]
MPDRNIASLRDTLDYLRDIGELATVTEEVSPILEISGIEKALENGPCLLFEKIRGYPGVRDAGNLFARRERAEKIFGAEKTGGVKFKCQEAMRRPLPPMEVKEAPCQEVVVTENIDVMATLPILKHTDKDGGRILGGGNTLISGKYFRGGTHISFNRMNFRGKDWSSISFGSGSHLEWTAYSEHRGERLPLTINIGTPPAVIAAAAAIFLHPIVPIGADELGFAGALQETPVEIVKAKTVDAYAIARAEWVIEGYVDTKERAWETDEAEKLGKIGVAPFFPEWTGYLGRAYRLLKFHATAITHRADRPIFYSPLANSFECDLASSFFREACYLELADRMRPGLVQDVNIIPGIAGSAGQVVFQVKKARRADEGHQRNLLSAALATGPGTRLIIVVDEDVDIYSPEDVLWALTTRLNPGTGIVRVAAGGMGQALMPMERAGIAVQASEEIRHEGGLGLDATVPFEGKWNFERSRHPVDKIDLNRWFSAAELARIRAQQSPYARLMSQRG